jgi:ppGpp synthetase/RelA/SpoT-type nucleotidyltranferase
MELIFIVKHITKEDYEYPVEEVLFATSDIDHAKRLLKDIDDTSFEEETDEYVETVGNYKNCYRSYHTISALRLFSQEDD